MTYHLRLISFLVAFSTNLHAEAERPNILLIMADDLGLQLGCYGDNQVTTPHIDGLAKEGTLFESAWVTSANCSPSRGSIFTGLYPHQNGLVGLAHHGFSLDKHYPTITSELHQAGYRTGIIGKYHLKPEDISPWDYFMTSDINPAIMRHNRDVRNMALMAEGFVSGNTGPFFLVMSYVDPHTPLYDQKLGLPEAILTAEDIKGVFHFSGYASPALKDRVASYLNCVNRLDAGVGMLLDILEKHELTDNTLIVFLSDHGPPFARGKLSSYDSGLRIPFIVKGPSVQRGHRSDYPVSTIDLFPTLLAFADVKPVHNLPGISLRSYLLGEASADLKRPLFASFYAHQKDNIFPMRAIRQDDWLLIENLDQYKARPKPNVDGSELWPAKDGYPLPGVDVAELYQRYLNPPLQELYNLARDPGCFDNLANNPTYHGRLTQLKTELQHWQEATGDPLLVKTP